MLSPMSMSMLRSKRPIFTVQKHQAPHLHYDFRLKIGGVLKSWAIPKGPSMDPSIKRLAVKVEDHDLRYAEFEGVIGEGYDGAGHVLVWDTGWFEPIRASLDLGLDVYLHGQRLQGGFTLARMKHRL